MSEETTIKIPEGINKVLIPANVSVRTIPSNEKVLMLTGRYFYGGFTGDTLVLQPEPNTIVEYPFNWIFCAISFGLGLAIGFLLK